MLRRVLTSVASSVANWRPINTPATALGVVADLGRSAVTGALSVTTWAKNTVPAVAGVTTSATVAGTTTAATASGVATSGVLRAPDAARVTEALDVVQIVYSLTHRAGGDATFSYNEVWTSPANAMGRANGTFATSQGEAVSARTRHLELRYADFPNKDSLTIQSVKLHFYVRRTGALGGLLAFYRAGASTLLENFGANNVDFLTTPKTYDVTAAYPTWTSLNNLSASVLHSTAAGAATDTVSFDAVEVEITATRTDTL